MAELVTGNYMEYKDKPLVREGNTICYGDMSEPYILVMEIMSYKQVEGGEVPDKILVQIIDSKDPTKIVKQGVKESLSDAFGIGTIWLDMALAK